MFLSCFIGFIAACLTVFINYCIGKPGTDNFSPNEIFSRYTIWLSKRRLIKNNDSSYQHLKSQLFEAVNNKQPHQARAALKDFYSLIYQAAEPFFTWERAFGMCQVCTGFWISLILGTGFSDNFFDLLIIIVISHITIRTLSKIL